MLKTYHDLIGFFFIERILVLYYDKCVVVEISSGSLQPHSLSSFIVTVKSVCITPCRKRQLIIVLETSLIM